MIFKKNKVALLLTAFILALMTSCGSDTGNSQTGGIDSPVTHTPTTDNGTTPPTPIEQRKNCRYKITTPSGCDDCPKDKECQIKIAQAHQIPYDTFRKAISNYYHKPGLNNIFKIAALLAIADCASQNIVLDGDHNRPGQNDDIKVDLVTEPAAKAYYEIPFFKGLMRLNAKEIYFYKGETQRGPYVCKDILIEVIYRDSICYYDLSDSEDI